MEIGISLVIGIIGIVVGAVVTWIMADRYYKRASEDLVKEAADLRKHNILILRALENAGLAEFKRDENGNIVGLVLNFSANIRGESETSSPELSV